jgi:dihydroneopterin aldolase
MTQSVHNINEFDIIHITGLEFYGYHGVPDAEQEIGHRYKADIALHIQARRAVVTDRLADTVDYGAVAALISRLGASDKCRLVETLAERMAAAIFAHHNRVCAIRLVLTKLLPPMGVIAESVGVEIYRTREDLTDGVPTVQVHAI